MTQAVVQTDFTDLHLVKRGKVRDIYDLGDMLLMVATDRISAFDVVMPTPIPDKGKLLTQISLFWFEKMADQAPHHVLSSDVREYPAACRPYSDTLAGRSMLVRKTNPLPVECVVRGYISGSGWASYRATQSVCGISLPAGLKESDALSEPIFTPSTKADIGQHDVNIDFEETAARIGLPLAEKLRARSLAIYRRGADFARGKGIIIADTKFEFGLDGDRLLLIDELLTPDSSRFWPVDLYRPGGPQQSFDKQYLRDYLSALDWDKTPPGPDLPEAVVEKTRQKYLEAFSRLTGRQPRL
jgi:phosphoribosylaminoimidazole-succinocarboxamide synthase